MFFDFTKETALDEKGRKIYGTARLVVYIFALLGAAYLSFIILFPSKSFVFSFENPSALSNTIIKPRSEKGILPNHGNIPPGSDLYFDTALMGDYSKALISFELNGESEKPDSGSIQLRKSYQAFFYPEGEAVGFKEGTLLKNKNDYFIISAGTIRKFSAGTLEKFGFAKEAFREADEKELGFNPRGADIFPGEDYPDGTLCKINDSFYILSGQKLKEFSSRSAFLSQYDENQAISKNEDFLGQYSASEEIIGFSDGSLISSPLSAFIVSEGKIFPINNPQTFEALGYDWNDVIPASGDELAIYAEEKLFNISGAHPDGTIFTDKNHSAWHMIRDGKKMILPSENIARSWLKKKPVLISPESLNISNLCEIKKNKLSFTDFSCEIPVENMNALLGKDYEFKSVFNKAVKINSISVEFKKNINWHNLKQTISGIINGIKNNYASQDQLQ